MSKALEIASERYAKGEITKEEFEDIKASLATSAPNDKPEKPKGLEGKQVQPAEKASLSSEASPPRTAAKAKSGGLPEWIWGPAIALVVLLVIGFFRYNGEMDRAQAQCMSQFNNAARCSCFIGELKAQTSILDETPLLRLLTDQSDARLQLISQNAIRRCIG